MKTDRMAAAHDREQWSRRANEIRGRILVSHVVGRVVALKKGTGPEWSGLCPFHNERTPSFTVNDKKGFYFCFGCHAAGDALAFVMARNGLEFKAAVELLESENGLRHLQASEPAPPPPKVPQAEDVKKAEQVQRLLRQCVHDPAVDQYLRGRSLLPPAAYGFGDVQVNGGWPADLMFHPNCYHGIEKREFPAMVAAFRLGDGTVTAVHRTYLKRIVGGWTKAGTRNDKMHLGPRKGALIRLSNFTDRMTAGEGIETSLSNMQLFRRAGFAYGSADAMAAVEPPIDVADLLIGADWNAKGRAGEKAAWKAKQAFSFGRQITIKVPNLRHLDKADFNDVLAQQARSGTGTDAPAERRSGAAS